jgi:hypothetical protein
MANPTVVCKNLFSKFYINGWFGFFRDFSSLDPLRGAGTFF